MASLFDLDNSSDSEDDIDYVPNVLADELSSDEEEPLCVPSSDDEIETKKKSRSKGKNSKAVVDSDKKSTEEIPKAIDGKKKSDDIYRSFLDEVAAEIKTSKNESMSSGISCAGSNITSPSSGISCAGSNVTSPSHSATISTPEAQIDFAVTEDAVQKDTVGSKSTSISTPDSKEENNAPAEVAVAPALSAKKRGLASVLGTLFENKKQKTTVMEKSLLDWKTFKKDEGLDQELEKYNRGKGGFIERQRFLERSDVRSYEIERDMRFSKRQTQTKKDA